MSDISPSREALKALAQSPETGPFVMLNQLQFRAEGGVDAYARYAEAVSPMLERIGARVVYQGRMAELLVGHERWDAILLVRYPSRQAFLQMIASPEYQAAHSNREIALERAVLYASDPQSGNRLG